MTVRHIAPLFLVALLFLCGCNRSEPLDANIFVKELNRREILPAIDSQSLEYTVREGLPEYLIYAGASKNLLIVLTSHPDTGRVSCVSLTALEAADGFEQAALASAEIFTQMHGEELEQVFETLGLNSKEKTRGFRMFEAPGCRFYYSSGDLSTCLRIENSQLVPTQALEVTTRTDGD